MSEQLISSELSTIIKILEDTLLLPISLSTADGQTQFAGQLTVRHPLFSTPEQLIETILPTSQVFTLPATVTTDYLEQFIMIPIHKDTKYNYLILGPCISQRFREEDIKSLFYDYKFPQKMQKQWEAYFKELTPVTSMRILQIGILAHRLINDEWLDVSDVIQYQAHHQYVTSLHNIVQQNLSVRRENVQLHHGIEHEQKFYQYIREGKTQELLQWQLRLPYDEIGILAKKSQLRNRKNLAIVCIAFATRAAIQGGVYVEAAFTMSDLHIQHIEELTDIKQVDKALIQACLEFSEKVNQNKHSALSKSIRQCQEYIYNHIYTPITLQQLAELTKLSRSYLSTLFKNECGVTINEFIQHERIEESKRLLDYTDDHLATISSKLCFCDETYFVKVFKKHIGMTPNQYRKKIRQY